MLAWADARPSATKATDLASQGCVLLRFLTGRPIFTMRDKPMPSVNYQANERKHHITTLVKKDCEAWLEGRVAEPPTHYAFNDHQGHSKVMTLLSASLLLCATQVRAQPSLEDIMEGIAAALAAYAAPGEPLGFCLWVCATQMERSSAYKCMHTHSRCSTSRQLCM